MRTRTPTLLQIYLCGGLLLSLSMGVRHGFGLWMQPLSTDYGWPRETFSLAIALQNLMWGASQPFIGMWADRVRAFPVLLVGAVLYALCLLCMASLTTPWGFVLGCGVLGGVAQSCCTYSVVYGIIGRNVEPAIRSRAMGVLAACGSLGQFVFLPLEAWLIASSGWKMALYVLGGALLLIIPVSFGLREQGAAPARAHQSVLAAAREALAHRSFRWLMAGYFVCGFQVVFIGAHLPVYLRDHGLGVALAGQALALIGLGNVFGTYFAGELGQRLPRRWILSGIYFSRAVVISLFLLAPLSNWSVWIFSLTIGLLWLSTVPPTNATVSLIFGQSHFSMLSGVVFFSHQIGSFLGVWLGGKLYDAFGNYNWVWALTIALGIMAGLANLPVVEKPIQRSAEPATALA